MAQVNNVAELQSRHGAILSQPPLLDVTSAIVLRKRLLDRKPSIKVGVAVCRGWLQQYRPIEGAVKIESAEDLEEKYGDLTRQYAVDNPTAYLLCKAYRARTPPVFITDGVAKQWFLKYCGGDTTHIDCAGHLEMQYGQRIRDDSDANGLDSAALSAWLRRVVSVSASARTCETWLSRDWSSSGKLLSTRAVEDALGERLRLQQYRQACVDIEAARVTAQRLAEGQPPHLVDGLLLHQWYQQYHPDAGPLRIETAAELEAQLGAELRTSYRGLGCRALCSALAKRRKPVLVTVQLCRTWLEAHSIPDPAPGRIRKRPAAAGAPVRKRPAAASWNDGAARKRPAVAPAAEPAVSSAASSSGLPAPVTLKGAVALEDACGDRYRREFCDLGLDTGARDMRLTLAQWGYVVSREACQEWLRRYRTGAAGSQDGGVAVFALYRRDLQYWLHVEKLSPTNLQAKFSAEHGVYADRANLMAWLSAPCQALCSLSNNEDIHTHACGEYVLERLQNGIKPEAVVDGLLREYLVRTTPERVQAYRFYREQRGKYWTSQKLERLQWEWLYGQVSKERTILPTTSSSGGNNRRQRRIIQIREALCGQLLIAEELVPLHNLRIFYKRHESHAQLALKYPQATVLKDCLPWSLVGAYQQTFRGQQLPATAFDMMRMRGHGSYTRAVAVAKAAKIIAMPLSCAEAGLVAAYAMLKCQELYAHQCWAGSVLTPVQRAYHNKYASVDFFFWVMYGSWSQCAHCRSMFFNDKYFSQAVYADKITSSTPDLLAPTRSLVPTDPLEHSHGEVGVSSRWWYLPGMYKPELYCDRCTRPAHVTPGTFLTAMLRKDREKYLAAQSRGTSNAANVEKTGQLYRVPRIREAGDTTIWAAECVTWPRYQHREFLLGNKSGPSMLDLTEEETRALQIVVLKTTLKQERYGASHQYNWKKTGLSRAYWKEQRVHEGSMPTPRAAAAYRFLMKENKFYKAFNDWQGRILANGDSLNMSSYDLFIVQNGIECAMFPHLYPTTDFTDTGILEHYKHTTGDNTNRVCSIGLSWTRKVHSIDGSIDRLEKQWLN